jgi:hypothetical protein
MGLSHKTYKYLILQWLVASFPARQQSIANQHLFAGFFTTFSTLAKAQQAAFLGL